MSGPMPAVTADRSLSQRVVVPAALYLLVFFLLNPHLLEQFSTHYFFGGLDGFQNVWNIWWVDQSVGANGRLPWWTTMLHYPYGTTLIGHTLNPFNGLLGIVLLKFLTMVQTYNTIVTFSFVMGGVTAFWLCDYVVASYAGSLIGGAVFTFSSFHFMHADSHLQIVALEWLPLFVLLWIRFCERPTSLGGFGAAMALFLVILCDVYYFSYCVFTGLLFAAWMARQRRDLWFLCRPATWRPFCAFLIPAALTSGAVIGTLIVQNATDPLLGTHSPRALAMDLLSPFVWGYFSRFRDVAEPLWRPLSPYVTQSSVYVGLTVVGMAIYGWRQRVRLPIPYLGFWCLMGGFFFVMALGPNLHVAGTEISLGLRRTIMGHPDVNLLVLPYGILWFLFPPWRLAGVPFLLMVMVQLVAAVLAAAGIRAWLASTSKWRSGIFGAWLVLFTIDFLPTPMATSQPQIPDYVAELSRLPDGAVLDLVSPAAPTLWYQTIHQKPIAFGYISRTPTSVDRADLALAGLIVAGAWERVAYDFHFRYIVWRDHAADVMVRGLNGAPLAEIDAARRIYNHDGVSIYEFPPAP